MNRTWGDEYAAPETAPYGCSHRQNHNGLEANHVIRSLWNGRRAAEGMYRFRHGKK
jgi:hypothetical protein